MLPGKGKGGKAPTGHGRGRRLPVQEYVDVAVPIDVAYDQFTQFEEFPKFMHRVERIEQRDDTTLMWHENIWGVRRSWEAEIIDQQPCERIAWKSTDGTQTVGVVTFHELGDRLTRVYVNHDFQPKGLFEKTASGLRMSRRALKSDLMRFKAFIEMRDDPTGAWEGVIEDGKVQEEDDGGRRRKKRGDDDRKSTRAKRRREEELDDDEELEDDEERDEDEEDTRSGRFKRSRRRKDEDEEDDEDAEDAEPVAEDDEDWDDEDEEEEPEPEPEPEPKKRPTRARTRRAPAKKRKATTTKRR